MLGLAAAAVSLFSTCSARAECFADLAYDEVCPSSGVFRFWVVSEDADLVDSVKWHFGEEGVSSDDDPVNCHRMSTLFTAAKGFDAFSARAYPKRPTQMSTMSPVRDRRHRSNGISRSLTLLNRYLSPR